MGCRGAMYGVCRCHVWSVGVSCMGCRDAIYESILFRQRGHRHMDTSYNTIERSIRVTTNQLH